MVMTEREVDSLWQDYLDHRSAEEDHYTMPGKQTGRGRLRIDFSTERPLLVKNILLFESIELSEFIKTKYEIKVFRASFPLEEIDYLKIKKILE